MKLRKKIIAVFCGVPLALGAAQAAGADATIAVAPQYGTTHVYVAPGDFDRFADAFIATFGGKSTVSAEMTVTPTPSRTRWRGLQTPVGMVSLFAFETPIPFPFGDERTGYLVTDMDAAVAAARANGADIVVAPFNDPIGRDALIRWPGGVNMQLYVHFTKRTYPPLQTVPENRVYLSPDRIGPFLRGFLAFSGGKIVSDEPRASGSEIGRPADRIRRVGVVSGFGNLVAFVTDGRLPYPYGRETTGYEVADLAATMAQAQAAGVAVLVTPHVVGSRRTAMVQFPGGYIAEIHEPISAR